MAKFVIKRKQNNEPYWHLVAANGKIVCWSGESFSSNQALSDNIQFVKDYAAGATIEEE